MAYCENRSTSKFETMLNPTSEDKENSKPSFKHPPKSNKKNSNSFKMNPIEPQVLNNYPRFSHQTLNNQNNHSHILGEKCSNTTSRNRRQTVDTLMSKRYNNFNSQKDSIESDPDNNFLGKSGGVNDLPSSKFNFNNHSRFSTSRENFNRYAANLPHRKENFEETLKRNINKNLNFNSKNSIDLVRKNNNLNIGNNNTIEEHENSNFSSQINGKFTYFSRTISTREQTNYNSDVYFQNGEELLPKLYPYLTVKRKRIFKNLELSLSNCTIQNCKELIILSKPLPIESSQILLNIEYLRDALLSSVFFNLLTSIIYDNSVRIMNIFIEEVKKILERNNKVETEDKNLKLFDDKMILRFENLLKSIEISQDEAMKYLYTLLSQDLNFVKNSIIIMKEILAHGIEILGGLERMSKKSMKLRNRIGVEIFQLTKIPKEISQFVVESSKMINEYFSFMLGIQLVHVVSKETDGCGIERYGENLGVNDMVNYWIYIDSSSITLALVTGTSCNIVVNYDIVLPGVEISDLDSSSDNVKIECIDGPEDGDFRNDSRVKPRRRDLTLKKDSRDRSLNMSNISNNKRKLGLKSKVLEGNKINSIQIEQENQVNRRQSFKGETQTIKRFSNISLNQIESKNQLKELTPKIQKIEIKTSTQSIHASPHLQNPSKTASRHVSTQRLNINNSRSISRNPEFQQNLINQFDSQNCLITIEGDRIKLEDGRENRVVYPSRNPSRGVSIQERSRRNTLDNRNNSVYGDFNHHNYRNSNNNNNNFQPLFSNENFQNNFVSNLKDLSLNHHFSQNNNSSQQNPQNHNYYTNRPVYNPRQNFNSVNNFYQTNNQHGLTSSKNVRDNSVEKVYQSENPLMKPVVIKTSADFKEINKRSNKGKFLGEELQPIIQKASRDRRSNSVNIFNQRSKSKFRDRRRKEKSPSPYNFNSSMLTQKTTSRRNQRSFGGMNNILGPRDFSNSRKKFRENRIKNEGPQRYNQNNQNPDLSNISQNELKKRLEEVSKKIRENLMVVNNKEEEERGRGFLKNKRIFENVFSDLAAYGNMMNFNEKILSNLRRF